MRVFLAHGASGGIETMKPWIDALRQRGFDAHPVALPRGTAERAVPAYRAAIKGDPKDSIIGGHSFGGRVASMIAADEPMGGLVLLSYPLHRPGRPDSLRTEHWPRIECPTLLLSGESDPFAGAQLLRTAIQSLSNAELVTYPKVGHGLSPVLAEAIDVIADFVARVEAGDEVNAE